MRYFLSVILTIPLCVISSISCILFWNSLAFAGDFEKVIAGPGKITLYSTLIGQVTLNEEKISHINPRYPGNVSRVMVSLGQKVRKGQRLAVILRNNGLQSYYMTSPTTGNVIEKQLSVGASVTTEDTSLTIADLSSLWVKVSLKPILLDSIEMGQSISITGRNQELLQGKVFYRSPLIDTMTRTATIFLNVVEHDTSLRPGMLVESHLPSKTIEVTTVLPLSALKQISKNTGKVALESESGIVLREVETGLRGLKNIEIKSGVDSGEKVIAIYPENALAHAPSHDHSDDRQKNSHHHGDE